MRSAIGISRPVAALVASTALLGLSPSIASAANADEVQLTGAFAAPISATEEQCTPEPPNRFLYGTQEPFNPANPVSNPNPAPTGHPDAPPYVAPNIRSTDNVTKQLQAGAVNDLCFGFTLSPNVEPKIIRTAAQRTRGSRIQDNPPVALINGTQVWADGEDHDDLKSATITMPPGFAGAPDWALLCSDEQFGPDDHKAVTCPQSTMAGTVFARATALLKDVPGPSGGQSHLVFGGGKSSTGDLLDDGGYVYNLEHGPNELARLGVVIQPLAELLPTKFTVRLVLGADGRIQSKVDNAPRHVYNLEQTYLPNDPRFGELVPNATPSPIYLESVAIRAWGATTGRTGMPQEFTEWGTDCSKPISANVSVETYLGAKSALDSNAFTMTGCDTLAFLPSLEVTTTEKKPAVPTGVNVKLGLGQTNSGPKSALLKDAEVTLPAGLEIGAQVASGDAGLKLCTAAQFAKDSSAANTCPAASAQGTVTIVTPLLSRNFEGKVYLGEQPAVGELPPLYLEASPTGATAADAPRIKLEGTVKVDENGNLTTTFKDAPQLRFSELRLTFPGGDNALFTTPRTCGKHEGTSQLTSWAKPDTKVPVKSEIDITEDCTTPGFAPSFAFESANTAVGNSAPTKITIAREDRSPWLKDVKVSLPAGFLADLKVATECSKADAAAGACPASARMGSVTTVAGVGPKPLSLGGDIFLVERNEGSVAGVVIVVDAKIGELQLGKVVVPGNINLRPNDAGLTMFTSAPLRFKGIALNLRSIVVNLDRENFPLNPTACGPLNATAEITGDGGQTAAPTAAVTYTGCASLPFQPGFQAELSGETGPRGHPNLKVTMTPRAGDSNLKSARVVLPKGISTDTNNLKNVCARDAFDAGTCPENTQVGTVAASVSITNDVIAGTVHLVRVEGTALPGIGMNFTGRYATRVLSVVKLDKDLRVITEFGNIPDLPLRRLDLSLTGGAKGPLQISPAACVDSAWEATLGGQGGQTSQVNQATKCKPVDPTQSASWSRKSGLKLTITAPTGGSMKSAKFTLPTGFKFKSGKARTKNVKVKVTGKAKKPKYSKSSISIVGTSTGATKVVITVKPGGYTLPKKYKGKLKKNAKLKFKTRVVTNADKVVPKTITAKVK